MNLESLKELEHALIKLRDEISTKGFGLGMDQRQPIQKILGNFANALNYVRSELQSLSARVNELERHSENKENVK